MRRLLLIAVVGIVGIFAITACSNSGGKQPAAKAVEDYLQAVVSGDENKVTSLSCKDWQSQATMEMDSFSGVKAALDQAACTQTGTDGKNSLVQCTGKIKATYNNEQQEFDLAGRTYQVAQEGGDWLVCGYK
jgi:hypothetical protein